MSEKKYILAGWLIDGSGAKPQKNALITLSDDIIESIDISSDADELTHNRLVDLSHCTLLPPLFDCSVQLCSSSAMDEKTRLWQEQAGFDEISSLISQHIHYCQSHGVLGIVDGSDTKGYLQRFMELNQPDYPELLIINGLFLESERDSLENNDHSSFIRVKNSSDLSSNASISTFSSHYTRDELQKLVQQAEQKGNKVVVVANGEEPVKIAIEAGCHAIEQGALMGVENLQRMAESEAVWIPSLLSLNSVKDFSQKKSTAAIDNAIKNHYQQLAKAKELGVKVALGTGAGAAGILHGESVVAELKNLIKSGYSLVEAIQCATQNCAELFDIENLGTIQVGKSATFLVSRGMPAQLPRKLSYLEAIYINGKPSLAYRKNPEKKVYHGLRKGEK